MTNLHAALMDAEVVDLGFDTAPIIYFVEANPQYNGLVTEVFQQVAAGYYNGFTSAISLTEVLVHPLRQGNTTLQHRYKNLLLNSEYFHIIAIDAEIAERAADLRARYNLRTPDSLQIAAALSANCEAFLTNDRGLSRVIELKVLVLDDLEL